MGGVGIGSGFNDKRFFKVKKCAGATAPRANGNLEIMTSDEPLVFENVRSTLHCRIAQWLNSEALNDGLLWGFWKPSQSPPDSKGRKHGNQEEYTKNVERPKAHDKSKRLVFMRKFRQRVE